MLRQKNIIYTGLGRRKRARAKIFFEEGSGIMKINSQPFFRWATPFRIEKYGILRILSRFGFAKKHNLYANCNGGGLSAQMHALYLALAAMLRKINTRYALALTKIFLFKKDSRIKEQRKYGLKKARKASQYTKR